MVATVKPAYINIFRRFTLLVVPGLLTLATSLTLVSCTQQSQKADNQSPASNVADANTSKIKTKVLRMGYQQAGDLVRVTKVLEKRLEPLGVKVEWAQFAQGPQLMEAMNVGKIDLGSVGETPPIFAQAAGAQITYVVGRRRTENSGKGSAIAVPPDSPIKSIKDIKGQKVVFQKASASHYFILRALEEAGLKYSDIQVLSIPNVEAASAFIEGKIPVWVTGDPHLARAEKLGKARVIKTSEGLDSPGGYYIGSKQFAIDNPELLRVVIEEIDKIERWAEAHPKDTAKLILPFQKLPPDVMDLVISRRSFGLRAISPDLISEQQRVADYFHKNGLIPKAINIKEATLTDEQYAAITPPTISQK
ncbi:MULTISPECIES: aliphatic sulfonate ABC transporter substrate-binding protein [unclassified Tolypothrix]|uniref:aliphatic sulfonate ABC transporter substrate-binding protein n=1 Tax=unclassified Tolypothrix TaxID=2649714 RepID=UPI0005EAA4AB|nr:MULTISPECIES: aliphatic sulfonate ABC transporter substrate-binding protein [unclassified Tolypothrix]BAY89944.1 aliphatic sulfonates ABC transporter substrate-binding protein [Microchaete diplosiphon NIES-3275]EKE96998.1 ABC transporter, substrate-binding protein, aliphatic sulfonates family protein [Tolypothrix sp. PCC 7601]MBE9087969.1 aliphatic sulfonate ABC transporter substrate-binding protein [Tolypothrix sp. LEGE 11397]UYD24177.1 aliphatic sulfonate ABC transporter substrate-binding 